MKKTLFPREFVEWITAINNGITERCGKGWRIDDTYLLPYKEYTLDEVYYYWLTEIKDKQ